MGYQNPQPHTANTPPYPPPAGGPVSAYQHSPGPQVHPGVQVYEPAPYPVHYPQGAAMPQLPFVPNLLPPWLQPKKMQAKRAVNNAAMLCLSMSLLSFVWQFLFLLLYAARGNSIYFVSEKALFWITAMCVPLSTLLSGVIFLFRKKPPLTDYFRFEHKSALFSILGIFGGLSLCLLSNYPANFLLHWMTQLGYKNQGLEPKPFDPSYSWAIVLATVILAPLMEEFVFRGIVCSHLEKYGKGFAIVVSGLIFGMAHSALPNVIFATLSGFVFGFLYLKTRNLWVPIAVHFLNNALAMLQTFSTDLVGEQADQLNTILHFGFIGLGLASIVFLLLFRRKRFFTLKEPLAVDAQVPPPQLPPQQADMKLGAGERGYAISHAAAFWVLLSLVLVVTGLGFASLV